MNLKGPFTLSIGTSHKEMGGLPIRNLTVCKVKIAIP